MTPPVNPIQPPKASKLRLLKPLELKLKPLLVDVSAPLLLRRRPDPGRLRGERMKRVLFLRVDKIGDMVITFPTVDALKSRHPHLKIAILASPVNYPLIEDDPRFDEVFLYRKSQEDLATIRRMRAVRRDCVFDTMCNDSVTTMFLTQLLSRGCPRVGLAKHRHAPYYDHNFADLDGRGTQVTGNHIIDDTLHLLDPFGFDLEAVDRFRPPHVPPAARRRVATFLEEIGGVRSGPLVGFNLSAGKIACFWPLEKAAAVCRRLLDQEVAAAIVLSTAPRDRAWGEYVRQVVGEGCYLAPELRLTEACDLVSRLALLISPDTSMIHVARSFRVPVVGLYSRSGWNTVWWGPYRQPEGIVVPEIGDRVSDITVDQVVERVQSILGSRRGPRLSGSSRCECPR